MKMSVSEFKARCTQVIREIGTQYEAVEVTNRGKTVVRVVPFDGEPTADAKQFFGSLRGSVTLMPGWEDPLGEDDWEVGGE